MIDELQFRRDMAERQASIRAYSAQCAQEARYDADDEDLMRLFRGRPTQAQAEKSFEIPLLDDEYEEPMIKIRPVDWPTLFGVVLGAALASGSAVLWVVVAVSAVISIAISRKKP